MLTINISANLILEQLFTYRCPQFLQLYKDISLSLSVNNRNYLTFNVSMLFQAML